MKACNQCLLTEAYPGLSFNEEGTCSMCSSRQVFEPYGEEKFIQLIEGLKAKKRGEYDALVPLSGGKDSMYLLYLAVKVYNLKVMTMTYDNGFVSQIAIDNMERAVKQLGVKHIVCKRDEALLKKIYRNMLLRSGDLCGACGMAIRTSIYKVANDYGIPMALFGTSPLEEDSFLPDTTTDMARFKYIMKESGNVTKEEIKKFLIYPKLNFFKLSLGKRTGKFPKEVCPFFYIETPSEHEIGEIIKRELGWQEDTTREYSKHFDCIVEPFTNYVRYHIYGYERRMCQYSKMVRRGDITRDKAAEMYASDNVSAKPANYQQILELLEIDEKEMQEVLKIKPLKYERHVSQANKWFARLMKFIK